MKLPDELQFIASARMPQCKTSARLDGKVCVITGATSGVGYEAAKKLARGGAKLVMVCRNLEKAQQVRQEIQSEQSVEVSIVKADFSKLSEVRGAAHKILKEQPKIDVLINNAGVHRTRRKLTEGGFETVFCVNHLASFLITRLLLDRLISSAPARIIQINSEGHRFGGLDLDDLAWERRHYRGLLGYGASKVAQLLTVWELSDLLHGKDVTINAMHPGSVRTNIGMDNGLIYQWYQRYLLWPFLKDPDISGEAIYYLAAAPEMQCVSGKFFNRTVEEIPAPHARNRRLGKEVWKVSENLTGLPHIQLTGDTK